MLLGLHEFFSYRLFPLQRGFVSGFGQAPQARRAASTPSRFPGRGHVLGSD